MTDKAHQQRTINPLTQRIYLNMFEGSVYRGVNSFLTERQSRGLSKKTLGFYHEKLTAFCTWLDTIGLVNMDEITTDIIREYILSLESTGHNPGGIHAYYRTIKAFLNWYWDEVEPERPNPIRKVRSPKVTITPLPGVSIEHVDTMIKVCTNPRDKAIISFLVD